MSDEDSPCEMAKRSTYFTLLDIVINLDLDVLEHAHKISRNFILF